MPGVVVHVSTIALPTDIGDFASGAVDQLQVDDVLVILFEYDAASADPAALRAEGACLGSLTADDFSPSVLQRTIPARPGASSSSPKEAAPFCLYAVIGSYAQRCGARRQGELGLGDGADRASGFGGAGSHRPPPRRRPHNRRRPRWCRRHERAVSDHHDHTVSVLAGPFVIASALIVLGGAFKAVDPADTAYALRTLGLAASRRVARARWRWAEVVIGVGALVLGGPCSRRSSRSRTSRSPGSSPSRCARARRSARAGASARSTRRRASCTSWSTSSRPVCAITVALAGDTVALPDVLADQPAAGVPFVILAVTGIYLVFLSFTALPKTLAAARVVREARG